MVDLSYGVLENYRPADLLKDVDIDKGLRKLDTACEGNLSS